MICKHKINKQLSKSSKSESTENIILELTDIGEHIILKITHLSNLTENDVQQPT